MFCRLVWFEHRIKVVQSAQAIMILTLHFVCVCVCFRDVGLVTSPSWIPSPLESGSSCSWPTWLSAASSFWWPGKEHTSKTHSEIKWDTNREGGGEQRVRTQKRLFGGGNRCLLPHLSWVSRSSTRWRKETFSSLRQVSSVILTPAGQGGNRHRISPLIQWKHY